MASSSTSAATPVDLTWIRERTETVLKDPTAKLARNVTTTSNPGEVALDRERIAETNNVFSHRVKTEGKATDQGVSGRCWMFAALNVMRLSVMEKCKLDKDFELSQSYLFFYDKLERANYFMQQIIETADQDPSSREVMHLLTNPVDDGGQLAMFQALVNKYGVVPKSVYGETYSSNRPGKMNELITRKLRDATPKIREAVRTGTGGELSKLKEKVLEEIHRLLVIMMGEPPQKFDWTYYDKDKKYREYANLDPHKFYQDFVPTKLEDFVSVVNDPRHGYNQLYSVSRLGNVIGTSYQVLYLNLPIEEIKQLARKKLEADQIVWFGCDVCKSLVRNKGILDDKVYDYELAFGTAPDMDKKQRLIYGDAMMTHAMAFSGFHVSSSNPGAGVLKWRVQNSWGDKGANDGYLVMTDEWFTEHVYQLAVEKKDLSSGVRKVWESGTANYLPPWDPMGALA